MRAGWLACQKVACLAAQRGILSAESWAVSKAGHLVVWKGARSVASRVDLSDEHLVESKAGSSADTKDVRLAAEMDSSSAASRASQKAV